MHTDPNYKFIEAWGIMASTWGVTRSESQVYALLLIQNEQMSAEAIMADLHMSRGNINTILHTLMDFELVFKSHIKGERKEYFRAETNLWLVMEKLVKYYKRRSLDKLVELVAEIQPIQEQNASATHLGKLKGDIEGISSMFGTMLEYLPIMQANFNQAPAAVGGGKVIPINGRRASQG
ncbi:MAG: hypothetical protein KBD41_09980 [Saprospiraceae bacterium]|nr:hypothetical protein [Saprospiraceae bacterium]